MNHNIYYRYKTVCRFLNNCCLISLAPILDHKFDFSVSIHVYNVGSERLSSVVLVHFALTIMLLRCNEDF